MKKILTVVVLSFLIFVQNSFSKTIGEGELKLSDNIIRYFHQYLKGKGSKRPMIFTIAVDGSYASYWYCGHDQCVGDNPVQYNKLCEIDAGIECKIFAKGKYIKWKNGINKGKGKSSKVSGRVSFNELKARLAELGFVDDRSSKNNSNNENSSKDISSTKDYPPTLFFPDEEKIENWKEFTKYGKGTEWPFAVWSEVRKNHTSDVYSYQWAARKTLNQAIKDATKGCNDRLKGRKKEFKNSQICIVYFINGSETTDEEKIKFAEKFYGKKVSKKSFEKNNWVLNTKETGTKKVAKKYNLEGDRSIALSWEGYNSLIAGSVSFNETDYKGTLSLSLPDGDGECKGSYSLQKDGKGTWQIGCTNDMGAAGTLKWNEVNGVTGSGRDHNDKKVKFTVAGKS